VDADGQPSTDPAKALQGGLVSAAGYKGWGLGLMIEVLAACMTRGVNSPDVKGLKVAEGPPHDLGQFYLLLDPGSYGDHFSARFALLSGAIAAQDGARIPGANRRKCTEVEVPDALWALVLSLAEG
jgi:(2R)-3-sulfolactate dehydrogenase (NADP+)